MPIIKLTECIIVETDKIKGPCNGIYWSEWSTSDLYLNTDKIICFKKCNTYGGTEKDFICNKPNFNTKIELQGPTATIYKYVKETPDKVFAIIKKTEVT